MKLIPLMVSLDENKCLVLLWTRCLNEMVVVGSELETR